MKAKYGYTILYVADVPKTMSFYKSVFGFEERLLTPEKDYGELSTGDTTLSFANFELGNSNLRNGYQKSTPGNKPFGIELAFIAEDIQSLMDGVVEAGGKILEPAESKPWGQQVGYAQDINGFLLEFGTAMEGH